MLDEPADCCRLLLLRHPELDAEHRQQVVGAGPARLGHRGRAQLADWLAWLDGMTIHEAHSSPQAHCLEACHALAAPRGLVVSADPRLRDQEMGAWQGRSWEDVAREDGDRVREFFQSFGHGKAPGGESLGEAVERVQQWWAAAAPRAAARSFAVVLPGSLLSGFAAAMLGVRLSRCMSLNLPHGGLGVLDVYQNGARIACWNPGALC